MKSASGSAPLASSSATDMPSTFIQLLRSRGFAVCLHACLWLLLCLAMRNLGGRAPDFREGISSSAPAPTAVPVVRLEGLFAAMALPAPARERNAFNPFFTRYFVPPPTPAPPPPPPPPPPPTTRKIDAVYQGFYQTADGPKHVMVKVADALVIAPVGAPIATNHFVAEATMQMLTLTNPAAQTNFLLLNIKKELEIPIR